MKVELQRPVMQARMGEPHDASELKKASQEFEALLLRQMVEAMRKTVGAEESSGNQMTDHLIESALADHLASSGGIGLSETLAGLEGRDGPPPHQVSPGREDVNLLLERQLRFTKI
jgi:hypothetical protein